MPNRSTIWRIPTIKIYLFLFFLAIIVTFQWRGNAFRSEFGGTPDEPAHYVTGLLVRDYITSGWPANPLEYARNYYVYYPKLGLGHWPPLFYVVQTAWSLVFTPSRVSMILLMGVLTAWTAAIFCNTLREEYPLGVAVSATVFLMSIPIMQTFSSQLMAEMLLALLALLAVIAYGRYLDSGRWQAAALFGLWSSLAMLTKGTGIELAFLPVGAVVLGHRWDLVKRFSFWLPAILVVSLAGPWYWFAPDARHESVTQFGGVHFQSRRMLETLTSWGRMLGPATILAMVGIAVYCGKLWRERGKGGKGIYLAGLSLLIGAYLFRVLVAAWGPRQLLTTIPVLAMFSVAGFFWLFSRTRIPMAIAGIAAAVLILVNIARAPVKPHYRFDEAAQSLVSNPRFADSVMLVCSGPTGEGVFIAEVAMREARPGHVVLRASKMLSSSNWMGKNYRVRFEREGDMLQYLEEIPVGLVVIDSEGQKASHGQLLLRVLRQHPEKWEMVAEYGNIAVFRLIGHEGKAVRKIEVPVPEF